METTLMLSKETKSLRAEIVPLVEYAKALVIDSPEAYEVVAEKLLNVKAIRKQFDNKFEKSIAKMKEALNEVRDLKKDFTSPLDGAEMVMKDKMLEYREAAERKRRADEFKLREKARKEQKRIDDLNKKKVADARKKGDEQLAKKIKENKKEVLVPTVESSTPKVEGIKTRIIHKYKVININLVPREYMAKDDEKLSELARTTKGTAKVPGIKFYEEEIILAGRRM